MTSEARITAQGTHPNPLPCVGLAVGDDGSLTAVNARLCSLLGYSQDELLGRPLKDFLCAASRALFEFGVWPQLQRGGIVQEARLSLLARDGSEIPMLCFAERDEAAWPKENHAVMVPIPRRKLLEHELLRVRHAVEQMPGGMFQLVAHPGGRFELPYFGGDAQALLGLDRGQTLGNARCLLRRIDRRDRRAFLAALCASATSGFTWQGEYRSRLPDGGIIWLRVQASSRPGPDRSTYWHGHLSDVTDSREAREALARSEERFRRLQSDTPAMMQSIGPAGQVLSVSRCWLEKLGYQENEVIGRPSTDFLTEAARRPLVDTDRPEFLRFGDCTDLGCQMVARDGRVLDVLLSASTERDAQGRILRVLAVCTDVTEERRLALQLGAEHERSRVALQAVSDAVITTDTLGTVSYLNPVAERMTGWTSVSAVGQPLGAVVRIVDTTGQGRWPRAAGATGERRGATSATLLSRTGQEYFVEESAEPIFDAKGALRGGVVVLRDVSEARAMALRMSYMAQHDPLTALPNRLLLHDRVENAIAQAQRGDHAFAIMFLDLDRFKQTNDHLGHAVGDELLRTASRRLVGALRAADTVSREGGDEFVILLSPIGSAEDAAQLAAKILRVLAEPCEINGHVLNASSSIGIALYPEDGGDTETLLRHADAAMYRAKTDGRNRYHFFSAASDEAAIARHTFDRDLRGALAQGDIMLHYQPRVCARTGGIIGTEALVRWRKAGGVLVPPGSFIPLAEACGLMVALGRYVLREACRQNKRWQDLGVANIPVSVNISAAQLCDSQLVPTIAEALAESGLDPRYLELEITETTAMSDADATLSILEQIKRLGVSVAIDDFGTGYSSLSYLKRFPVDTLKIDQSFIRDVGNNAGDYAIVAAIVNVAKALSMRVVAEGVESVDQEAGLLALGCEEMQGYYYARPDSAERVGVLLARSLQPCVPALAH